MQTRNTKEFEESFRRLFKPLCMYALHYVHDINVAEDIVEDCFVRVLQKGLPEGSGVASFMHVAVRNRAIDHLRRTRPECSLAEDILLADDDDFDGSAEESRIWDALDRLPEKRRQIFIMSRRDGMSHEEIASELGISVRTVKNQISRALKTFDQQKFLKILTFFF